MGIELGFVTLLGADAVGPPGQRRFRLFVQSKRGSAVLWMEKEQLESLSLTLDRFLSLLTEGQVLRVVAQRGEAEQPESMPESFPRMPDSDFRVGQMKLSYDEEDEEFLLVAVPLEIIMEPGRDPQALLLEDDAVSFTFKQQEAQELAGSINTLVTAGRPVCPFCRTPLDGRPHACVKQNGHRDLPQLMEREGEEE